MEVKTIGIFFFHFVFFVDYLSLFCNPAEKVGLMLL